MISLFSSRLKYFCPSYTPLFCFVRVTLGSRTNKNMHVLLIIFARGFYSWLTTWCTFESWRSGEESHGRLEEWSHCSALEIGRSYGCEEFRDLKKYQPLAASHLNFEKRNYNNNQIFISWSQELPNSSLKIKRIKVRLLSFPPTLSKLLEITISEP